MVDSTSTTSTTMFKLTSSNYSIWNPTMEYMLHCNDLYQTLENKETKPADRSDDDWHFINKNFFGHIQQWVDQSIFHRITQEIVVYMLWMKLETLYERNAYKNKASTIWRLVKLKYRETNSVFEHLSYF